MTQEQREAILLEIFSRFQCGAGLGLLRSAAPDVSDEEICEFVEEAFDTLIDWNCK